MHNFCGPSIIILSIEWKTNSICFSHKKLVFFLPFARVVKFACSFRKMLHFNAEKIATFSTLLKTKEWELPCVCLVIVFDSYVWKSSFSTKYCIMKRSVLFSSIMEIANELVDSCSASLKNEIGMLIPGRD